MFFSLCALVLFFDLIFGEPVRFLHPVVWIGKMISALEKCLYVQKGILSRFYGAFLAFLTLFFSGAFGFFAQNGLLKLFPYPWNYLAIAAAASTTIGMRSLFEHARPILRNLCAFRTLKSRKYLAMIVGRDTESLSRSEISRAAVESLSESLGDGIIAPLFYFALFGLPGAFVYRAANTLDSMLGHKDEKYTDFGWASARFDDILNFLPARICAFPAMVLSSSFFGKAKACAESVFKYHKAHSSPNSGYYESAASGLLNLRLGGINYYDGEKHEVPVMNPKGKNATPRHILVTERFIFISAIFAALEMDILILIIKQAMEF